jgi:acetyltransferase-like isoleucine patch superfamily enzyme
MIPRFKLVSFFNIFREYKIILLNSISSIFASFWAILYGIKLGSDIKFIGVPKFYRAKGSSMVLKSKCTFISNSYVNLIGVNHRCILSTLRDGAKLVIEESSGFSGVTIGCAKRILIGRNVMVGANVLITDTNWHNISVQSRNLPDPYPKDVVIEDNVFIGYGSIILKGVTIGRNSVIGAGSVVCESIPSNCIAKGNPCRVVRSI